MKNKSELDFEKELIRYLENLGGSKQWEYKKDIKTTEQLWDNFKLILEQNNRNVLGGELSEEEFNQVKRRITNLDTPYQAGQFLYGINGISQIDVERDNGEIVYLTVFDQNQIGAGDTVYQIVNQIQRPKILPNSPNRRFDVTLLINGLPIIQIELKRSGHSTNNSLNQMERYIHEKQYGGIYSTLQILVAMTPYDIKYMANTTKEQFNKAFAFNWQNEHDSKPIYDWKIFCDKVLSIPMAHELATRYMILDGTKNRESIKVMRPYQMYATKKVLERVRDYDFKYGDGRLGYVWHTTGSGKTITSFKTAWLASRLPNVDKVIFLVDRIALTNQTYDAYNAYDPMASIDGGTGVVSDTAHVSDLHNKFRKKSDKNIIVTSIQKMVRYVKRKDFKPTKLNILFIVDEAHRSTGDGVSELSMIDRIKKAIPNAGWVGYTGTPKFEETRMIFGNIAHSYTIKEAIADKNVLGFNVEFKETIKKPDKSEYGEDDSMDNRKKKRDKECIYDYSKEHVDLVVKDIMENWKSRSSDYRYNALFTVRVGGGKASTPRAMEYFRKFIEENKKKPENERLKIGISFSQDNSNSDNQLENNQNLEEAMKEYNKEFGTNFNLSTAKEYATDIASRLNKTSGDGKYLDLLIVVDQFLTGFDAPQLNTLYVDRTLRGANLIQAYSRTNRIYNMTTKPWGNIINYRWPEENEYEMNKSFAIYANRDSASEQLTLQELMEKNKENSVTAKTFEEYKMYIKGVINDLSNLTDNFTRISPSEHEQDETLAKLFEYSSIVSKLKQFTEDENGKHISAYDDPEGFYDKIGISEEDEIRLTTSLFDDLVYKIRSRKGSGGGRGEDKDDINLDNIDYIGLELIHIHDVKINYDYLVDLIARMADEVHDDDYDSAKKTRDEIYAELAKSEDEKLKKKIGDFVARIFAKEFEFESYPAPRNVEKMNEEIEKSNRETNLSLIVKYIRRWGLDNSVKPEELKEIIRYHKVGNRDDLDKKGELNDIINNAHKYYKEIAAPDVKKLSWIKYRKEVRDAAYEMADEIRKLEF